MVVICIGPVCIPAHMLLAAFLGFLHSYGWFTWIKTEWVTYRYWKYKWQDWRSGKNKQTEKAVQLQPLPNSSGKADGSISQQSAGQSDPLIDGSNKAESQQPKALEVEGQPRKRAAPAGASSR